MKLIPLVLLLVGQTPAGDTVTVTRQEWAELHRSVENLRERNDALQQQLRVYQSGLPVPAASVKRRAPPARRAARVKRPPKPRLGRWWWTGHDWIPFLGDPPKGRPNPEVDIWQ